MRETAGKPKGRMMLYVSLLLLALWAMWGLRNCSTDSPFRRDAVAPSGGDTLDVAIEYSPLSLYRYADTLGGFNYDLLRSIAAEERIELKFHPVSNYDAALSQLDKGRFDIIVADVPMTSEYEGRYLYTEPAFIARQVLIQLRDSAGGVAVRNRLELARKTVHVSRGSSARMRLENLADEIGDTIYVVEDSLSGNEQLFLLVAAGQVPLAVVNEKMAQRLSPKFRDVDLSTEVSFNQFHSWILRRDDASLKSRLDTLLVRYKQTPEYDMLLQRYQLK